MNRRTRVVILAALAALACSLLIGCVRITKGAIRNTSAAPVSVILQEVDGSREAKFEAVAPDTTTPFEVLAFEKFKGVMVKILSGDGQGGPVDLQYTQDNVVIVGADAPPRVESQENAENTWW